MSDPQSKAEIVEQLRQVQDSISEIIQRMPAEQFYQGTPASWSPCNYLKHLLLSVKPFAKGMNYPPEQIKRMFGESPRPSMTYAELVAKYQARLDDGIRAEDYDAIMPTTFRIPEGTTDVQTYLITTWDEANERLITGLAQWSETDLDTHQLLHPAIGPVTIREMLFFTLYHNRTHGNDIRSAGAVV